MDFCARLSKHNWKIINSGERKILWHGTAILKGTQKPVAKAGKLRANATIREILRMIRIKQSAQEEKADLLPAEADSNRLFRFLLFRS
jgi:hypothetical protein